MKAITACIFYSLLFISIVLFDANRAVDKLIVIINMSMAMYYHIASSIEFYQNQKINQFKQSLLTREL